MTDVRVAPIRMIVRSCNVVAIPQTGAMLSHDIAGGGLWLAGRGLTLCRCDDKGLIAIAKGSNMSQSVRIQRRDQAATQRRYRQQQSALRKPSRDDVARVALHWIITAALERSRHGELGKWSGTMVKRLVEQGFDGDAAQRRIAQLIDRYEDGWTFQRKPHLAHDDEA